MALAIGCAEPAPPAAVPPIDAAPEHDTATATYVEGSERVWNEARERGVVFRAVGEEPGWLLEIQATGEVLLLTDYAQDTVRASIPAAEVARSAGTTSFVTGTEGGGEIRIDIRSEPCTDTMSGERFSRTVTVVREDGEYRGCGRPLTSP
ncbi:MAG TPA: hypothetical protein VFZ24_04580 [Longimicrobiales bacterium]